MAILDDLNAAVRDYCKNSVTLSVICNLTTDCVSGTQNAVNVNEVWRFKVRVSNNGLLNLTGLNFHIIGQTYIHNSQTKQVLVSTGSTGPIWATGFIAAASLSVNSGGTQDSAYYYFKTPSGDSDSAEVPVALIKVHIAAFDANLDQILKNNTGDTPSNEVPFTQKVYL